MASPPNKDTTARLQRRARRAGVTLAPATAQALASYFDLLFLWNQKINLTGLQPIDEAIDRLLIEPVLAARHLPSPTATVIDIGSGGGSPALPLKLAAPGIVLHMVESKTRKSAFLREAVRQLALGSTTVYTSRYEELLSRPELHEAADALTIRAVRIERRSLLTLQAFVKVGGRLLLFRGPAGLDEPAELTPPLVWETTVPLIESLRSRLTVLRKGPVGL